MKNTKNIITILLIVAIFSSFGSVFAADFDTPETPVNPDEYQHILAFSAGLSIGSGGKSTSSGILNSWYSTDKIYMTITLQKKPASGSWSYVTSWSGSGTGYLSMNKNYYVVPGYNYRCIVRVSVYSSSGTYIEGDTSYSNIVYY